MEHYHNDSVIDRIMKEEGVSREDAERYFEGALQFLEVAAEANGPVSPSLPIDAAWHAFVLHTRDYAKYCQERFGRFIHHQPTSGVSNRDNYLRARALAGERFDTLDPEVWPEKSRKLVAAGACAPDSDCHDDDSCDAV